MIDAAEFRKQWGDELVLFSADAIAEVDIPDDAKAFLSEAGLPASAAPFLEFEKPEAELLATVASQWQLSSEYGRYREIGFSGEGDPLCLDEADSGAVVLLNHEEGFSRTLVNSSVLQLAESMLAFRQLVTETQAQNGEDAYLDNNIPPDLIEQLERDLTRIDTAGVVEGTFWWQQLQNLAAGPY